MWLLRGCSLLLNVFSLDEVHIDSRNTLGLSVVSERLLVMVYVTLSVLYVTEDTSAEVLC